MRYSNLMRRRYDNYFRDVETTCLSAPASETVRRVSISRIQLFSGHRNDVFFSTEEDFTQLNEMYHYIIIISLWCERLFLRRFRNIVREL